MRREVPEVDPREATGLADAGALLLDVREPDEWEAGRIPGALHIPMGDLQARQDAIPTDRRIVAVCRSGARSSQVTLALNDAGYDAVNLAGGMQAWAEEGLPMESDAGPPRVV